MYIFYSLSVETVQLTNDLRNDGGGDIEVVVCGDTGGVVGWGAPSRTFLWGIVNHHP